MLPVKNIFPHTLFLVDWQIQSVCTEHKNRSKGRQGSTILPITTSSTVFGPLSFSMAEPIPVSFRQLFLKPLMKTQSARQQTDAKFLLRSAHSFYCEEATVRAAGRKPIKPARRLVPCATLHVRTLLPPLRHSLRESRDDYWQLLPKTWMHLMKYDGLF